MRIAVAGGGINGVMSAWALARRGHGVDLYERGELMGATSSASTKLLHGGLRYLEHGEFGLVREALRERAWWIREAPRLARFVPLVVPVFKHSRRPRWMIEAGLTLYGWLAGGGEATGHRWLPPAEVLELARGLRADGLLGGYLFHDGQMDDRALGLWAAEQAARAGVALHPFTPVERVTPDGRVFAGGRDMAYDRVVNASGPWARQLLDRSGIGSRYELDLVRGSHLVLPGEPGAGLLLEAPGERRIFFVLPWQGRTLLGTTEVRQGPDEPPACSEEERDYLLRAYNSCFFEPRSLRDVMASFSGIRPLIRSAADPSRASRESALERTGRLITIFGGKWTSAHALGERVAADISA